MKTININNKSEISGEGNLHSAHCKPIICIDTGAVYTSVTDAANAVGCSISNMINHLKGKLKTCKGKHLCYLSEATENLDAIVSQIRNMNALRAKAAAWDALQAEQEAARKAEEKRLADIARAEAKRQADIAKATAKRDKAYQEYLEALAKYGRASDELGVLLGEDQTTVA
jgi:hypothetical protein